MVDGESIFFLLSIYFSVALPIVMLDLLSSCLVAAYRAALYSASLRVSAVKLLYLRLPPSIPTNSCTLQFPLGSFLALAINNISFRNTKTNQIGINER